MLIRTTHAIEVAHVFFPSKQARHFFAFSRDTKLKEVFLKRGIAYHDSVVQTPSEVEYGNRVLAADGHTEKGVFCAPGMIMVRLFHTHVGSGESLTACAGKLERDFDSWIEAGPKVAQPEELSTAG